MLDNRTFLNSSAALALAIATRHAFAHAATMPIVFVHGDSDQGSI